MSALVDELRRQEQLMMAMHANRWIYGVVRFGDLCSDHAAAILRVLEAAEGVADGDDVEGSLSNPEASLKAAVAAMREVKP